MDARLKNIKEACQPIIAAQADTKYCELNPIHLVFECVTRLTTAIDTLPKSKIEQEKILAAFLEEMQTLLDTHLILRISNPSLRHAFVNVREEVAKLHQSVEQESSAVKSEHAGKLFTLQRLARKDKEGELPETLFNLPRNK